MFISILYSVTERKKNEKSIIKLVKMANDKTVYVNRQNSSDPLIRLTPVLVH